MMEEVREGLNPNKNQATGKSTNEPANKKHISLTFKVAIFTRAT